MIAIEVLRHDSSTNKLDDSSQNPNPLCYSFVGSSGSLDESAVEDSSDELSLPAVAEQPGGIREKFKQCISNMQEHSPRKLASQIEYVSKPSNTSQSDIMFKDVESFPLKTDQQLSKIDQPKSQQTAEV